MQSPAKTNYPNHAVSYRQIPSKYGIDYAAALAVAPVDSVANLVLFLRETLPPLWRDAYLDATSHRTNLVRLRLGTFEYICDIYSDLEAKGEVAYDQTVQDRVVVAFGISGADALPNARRSPRWIDPNEQLAVTERDHGHLIARCIGGRGFPVNVFSQARMLNRGQSTQGKIYRQMETYCSQRPGTFCFSRPIYDDNSCVPQWLEFGLMKEDQTLWVEVFEN